LELLTTKLGDIIALLEEYDAPLILRPKHDRYETVGESFMGVMERDTLKASEDVDS
jgi:hypothetical protein